MDPNTFKTSFIPKKPLVATSRQPRKSVGLITIISTVILFASLVSAGGVFLWHGLLVKSVASKEKDLEAARDAFSPETISEMSDLDKRLTASSGILKSHTIVSPIFAALEDSTLKTVGYTQFAFTHPTPDAPFNVTLQGTAQGYKEIALQADMLTKNKYIRNPLFSNLVLDKKGNVNFNLQFTVDPIILSYTESFNRANTKTRTAPVSTPPASSTVAPNDAETQTQTGQ